MFAKMPRSFQCMHYAVCLTYQSRRSQRLLKWHDFPLMRTKVILQDHHKSAFLNSPFCLRDSAKKKKCSVKLLTAVLRLYSRFYKLPWFLDSYLYVSPFLFLFQIIITIWYCSCSWIEFFFMKHERVDQCTWHNIWYRSYSGIDRW
jgi:hypothetical protein